QRPTTLNQPHLALSIGRVEAQLDGVAIGIPAMQGDFEIGVGCHWAHRASVGVRFSSSRVPRGGAPATKEDTPAEPHEANLFVKRWGVEAVNLDFAGKTPQILPFVSRLSAEKTIRGAIPFRR